MAFETSVEDNIILHGNEIFYVAFAVCEMPHPLEIIPEGYGASHMEFTDVQEAELFEEPWPVLHGFSHSPPAFVSVYRQDDADAVIFAYGMGKQNIIGVVNGLIGKTEAVQSVPSEIFIEHAKTFPPVEEAIGFYTKYQSTDARMFSTMLYGHFLQKTHDKEVYLRQGF